MKMFFVSLTLIMAVGSTNIPPGESTDVNRKIIESFKNEFAGTGFVKCNKAADYQMAKFEYMSHRMSAHFDKEGILIGSARCIFFNRLPLSVFRSFENHFTEYVCIRIHEIFNLEAAFYLLMHEAKIELFHLKADM